MRSQRDGRRGACARGAIAAACLAVAVAGAGVAHAETLRQALAETYRNSPTLNAQRAGVRATDENVPIARAGLMPKVFASASVGSEWQSAKLPGALGGGRSFSHTYPRGYSLNVTQPLFDGFRTPNSIRQAEAGILSARDTLTNTEQTVLFDAVQAYMNLIRDFALWNLQRNNVNLLSETRKQTNERFNVGEVTRTDVAQADASLASARSALIAAEAQLKSDRAVYQQVIGVAPGKLYPARPADNLLPRSLDAALAYALKNHPAYLAALHTVDVDEYEVKIAEGALLPTASLTASAGQEWQPAGSANVNEVNSASVMASLTVPIYQGGSEYAAVRKAKETLGQARIQADLIRDQVREGVVSAWGSLEGARASIAADQAAVNAAKLAVNGMQQEVKVGQGTTLDLLTSEQTLLNAQVALIGAQRDRVVASYGLLQAMGQLTAERLSLEVARYNPQVHYHQVRDKWFGLRTPEGD
jgi:outer membrane protein